jgi:hypothetical protein
MSKYDLEKFQTHIKPRTADEWWEQAGSAMHPYKPTHPSWTVEDSLCHMVLALIRDLAVEEQKNAGS